MRRLIQLPSAALLAVLVVAVLATAPASGAEFGLKNLDLTFTGADGSPAMQAGSHPFETTVNVEANTELGPGSVEIPSGALKDLKIDMPPGVVGDPKAVPPCSSKAFFEFVNVTGEPCPDDTVVGFIELSIGTGADPPQPKIEPVYNLETVPGEPLRLGFIALAVPVAVDFHLNNSPPYARSCCCRGAAKGR